MKTLEIPPNLQSFLAQKKNSPPDDIHVIMADQPDGSVIEEGSLILVNFDETSCVIFIANNLQTSVYTTIQLDLLCEWDLELDAPVELSIRALNQTHRALEQFMNDYGLELDDGVRADICLGPTTWRKSAHASSKNRFLDHLEKERLHWVTN